MSVGLSDSGIGGREARHHIQVMVWTVCRLVGEPFLRMRETGPAAPDQVNVKVDWPSTLKLELVN